MARTSVELRAAIEAASAVSGLSLAQEVERRLEASFAEDRMRVIAREEIMREATERASAMTSGLKQPSQLGPCWPSVPNGQRLLGRNEMLNGKP